MNERTERQIPFEQRLKAEEGLLEQVYLRARKKYDDLPAKPGENFSPEKKRASEATQTAWRKFIEAISINRARQIVKLADKPLDKGQYHLEVSFLDRSGDVKTIKTPSLILYSEKTADHLAHLAFDGMEMQGLHNFGLGFQNDLKIALVDLEISKEGDPKFSPIKLFTWIDRGGHRVNERTQE